MDKFGKPIFLGKTLDPMFPVLMNASDKIVRYANVESAILFVREDVYMIGICHFLDSRWSLSRAWILRSSRRMTETRDGNDIGP